MVRLLVNLLVRRGFSGLGALRRTLGRFPWRRLAGGSIFSGALAFVRLGSF
jgi:hypothetical protein